MLGRGHLPLQKWGAPSAEEFFFSTGPEAQESVMEEGIKAPLLGRALGGDAAGREERVVRSESGVRCWRTGGLWQEAVPLGQACLHLVPLHCWRCLA